MKTIWKFEVPITDAPEFTAPVGARILSAHLGQQNRTLYIWAEVNPDNLSKARYGLRIIGTGNPVTDVGRFVATVQDQPFVWHVYEETTK